MPALPRLEAKDWELSRALLRKCGELGLLGLSAPEQYGGLDLDKASSLVVVERIARSASFATTFGGQANLTVLPIVLFGTEAQKAKYLPRLLSGEIVGAYALSESGSGSDALAAKTRATKQPDGSWSLSGEKMWISNGGFADLFIVFAKVDGEQFTAFIVERAFGGLSSGKEEHKMGLHGSSTTTILLQDVRGAGRERARRDRPRPQGGAQHAQLRPLQPGRDVRRRQPRRHRRRGEVRRRPQAVRPADRRVRRDQAQARRDGGAHLRGREPGLPHRRAHRRRHRAVGPRRRRRSPARSRSSPSKRRSAR